MLIGLRVRNRVPNIKSQKKRVITNAKANERNKAVRSKLHTAERKVEDAVAAGDADAAKKAAEEASRLLDKAATKGVIHKNQAANRKSTLTRQANSV
jgi:small subunit ribosomal protein S20